MARLRIVGDTSPAYNNQSAMPVYRPSYRDRFCDAAEASSYDNDEYSEGTYPTLVWRIEQAFLHNLVSELRRNVDEIHYLDFACGTGRILSFLEPMVDHATGVEISESMLARAAQKVRSATLIRGDITRNPGLVSQGYDLITAFRFLLNAEPDLRLAALRQLAAMLRNDRSLLVFNNHINFWSYKLATWPSQRLIPLLQRSDRLGNFLTFRQVRDIAAQCGLVIERRYGCGFLSRRALKVLPYHRLLELERALAERRWLQPFGADQIYVARRAGLSTFP